MGAQQSSDLMDDVSYLKEFLSLTKDSVARMVVQVNDLGADLQGRELRVSVKGFTDDQILWRSSIRFNCHLENIENGEVVQRELNLRQFIVLRRNVIVSKNLMDAVTSPLPRLVLKSEDDLCCVCLERDCQVTLPCSHSYCPSCIQEWQMRSRTCPLCRDEYTEEDQWVIEDAPDISDAGRELRRTLADLLRT